MPDGIWPVRELEYTSRYLSSVSALIVAGIEPVRLLLSRYSSRTATSDPIDAGILPVKELKDNERYVSPVHAPIEAGIEPIRRLL